jgi:transglutaminase-like putative cysteine protease
MRIRVGYDIVTNQSFPTPMVLALHVRPELQAALVLPDDIHVSPAVSFNEFLDCFGNRCTRLLAPAGSVRFTSMAIIEDDGQPDPASPDAIQHPIEDLPADCFQFLLGSRYCEVDKLSSFAWDTFGSVPPGWGRAQAICDWVNAHVTFGYEFASPSKTAVDVFHERRGVCRDFQHLAVTLCRSMGIPARYVTGYLGDIGIPLSPAPMDFSAWFEAYLGGEWRTFDARFNSRRIGRILMAVGRDATDVAMVTAFGSHVLEKFEVVAEEVDETQPDTTP